LDRMAAKPAMTRDRGPKAGMNQAISFGDQFQTDHFPALGSGSV
jgi:hypothetical protein